MKHPMRIELTREGLQDYLTNHYSTRSGKSHCRDYNICTLFYLYNNKHVRLVNVSTLHFEYPQYYILILKTLCKFKLS